MSLQEVTTVNEFGEVAKMHLFDANDSFILRVLRNLHFEFLVFTFGAATLMWIIDCIASAIDGEGFLSFELPLDIWISVWTVVGGLLFYGVMLLIFTLKDRKQKAI